MSVRHGERRIAGRPWLWKRRLDLAFNANSMAADVDRLFQMPNTADLLVQPLRLHQVGRLLIARVGGDKKALSCMRSERFALVTV